eukprot:TRINITY_DN43397_c0_g1_i1.p3 TRINITY_DN43397_c0_g1~~TRINITY_DN43397_c0_g1_i1.p3  ORF type:complete len:100 (-),score=2.80 TRINITY_DN43397_c0_g1_i1:137-436(-)
MNPVFRALRPSPLKIPRVQDVAYVLRITGPSQKMICAKNAPLGPSRLLSVLVCARVVPISIARGQAISCAPHARLEPAKILLVILVALVSMDMFRLVPT